MSLVTLSSTGLTELKGLALEIALVTIEVGSSPDIFF